ncbi:hypothetical protein ABXT60_07345 [Candidatus Njordibacter sp. Uisw_056]|jgi:hypothetical protein|uniref:hypothetical protein n=1 Tax=Candidatus Njordibacter sp. Uisw_056 TaxID=3230973 RepID=UPI003D42D40B|tara:strand:+ start:170 stop:448 length:279 start_codon:yes stop_codon:yes gene_type:complete
MSIVRITTITLISQEVADAAALSYAANAVKDFPSAEQLIGIRSEGSKLIAVSIYESQAAMDKADAERDKRMANPDIVSMESVIGEVTLNHIN